MNDAELAIKYLDAVEIAPVGNWDILAADDFRKAPLYAYPAGYAHGFRICTLDDLIDFAEALSEANSAGEKLDGRFRRSWHSANRLMPTGWKPGDEVTA